MKIDPNQTWQLVEQRYHEENDPVVKRNLELVLEHMKAEGRGDIEGVVATLSERPIYKTHSNPDEDFLNPCTDKDAVRHFYDLAVVQPQAHQLEFDCDRVIADRTSVFTEGRFRQAYPGAVLQSMGIEVDDPNAMYLSETRLGIVWPVDPESGMLRGEEVYSGTDSWAGIADRKVTEIVPIAEAEPAT